MTWVKMLHVVAVFIWIGNLLTLTRLMGYHVKEEPDTQMRLAKIYHRIYNLVQMPMMIVAIVLGIFMLTQLNLAYKPGWFHMKLLFVMGLIVCDVCCGRFVAALNLEPDLTRGVKYKILHGVTGLLLIATLFSIYVVRDKTGEIINSHEKMLKKTEELQSSKI